MLCSRIAFEAIGSNSKDRMQSQPPPPSGQLSTTEQLQKYILQLTAYISDNNVKYNKNMNTLQEYYKQQHEALLNDNELLEEEQLALRNELAAHKDLLANKDRQTEEAEEMLESEKKEN